MAGRTFSPQQRARGARTMRARLLLQHLALWKTDSAVPDDELTTAQRRAFEAIRLAAARPFDGIITDEAAS